MAAKGTDEKIAIINKILEVFDGSFVTAEGKEIRIPINGMEIKAAFTCAKDVLGGSTPTPTIKLEDVDDNFPLPAGVKVEARVTDEEKENLQKLMSKLNINA